MTKVVSDLLTNVDSGSPSLLLSLDISAACDTLNHRRLLQLAQDLFDFTRKSILWLNHIYRTVEVLCPLELASQTLLHTV